MNHRFINPQQNISLFELHFDPLVGFPSARLSSSNENLFNSKREYENTWQRILESGRDKIYAQVRVSTDSGEDYFVAVRGSVQRSQLVK